MKVFIVSDVEKNCVVGDFTIKDFYDWYVDSTNFEKWVEEKNYVYEYALKRLSHDLKFIKNYSFIDKKSLVWNGFEFSLNI